MLIFHNCLFPSPLGDECSDQPIQINVTSTDSCLMEANITLPKELGKPYVNLYSCNNQFCDNDYIENHELKFHNKKENSHFFTKLIDPAENKSFKLMVYGEDCRSEVCSGKFNSHLFSKCQIQENQEQEKYSLPHHFIVLILTVLLVLVVVGILVAFRFKSALKCYKTNVGEADTAKEAFTENCRRVFIVYAADNLLYENVILQFATLLEGVFGFEIYLDLYDKQKIYKSPADWLEKCLETSDKILVLLSPEIEMRWKNNDCKQNRLDVTSPLIKMIKNDEILKKNKAKLVFAYFNSWGKEFYFAKLFCGKFPYFKLMLEFEPLLQNLFDDSSRKMNFFVKIGVTENESVSALNDAISKLSCFVDGDKRLRTSKSHA